MPVKKYELPLCYSLSASYSFVSNTLLVVYPVCLTFELYAVFYVSLAFILYALWSRFKDPTYLVSELCTLSSVPNPSVENYIVPVAAAAKEPPPPQPYDTSLRFKFGKKKKTF